MEQLIGKKLRVRINDRDERGVVMKNRFTHINGICTFIGFNENIGEWQVTLGRTPIFPIEFRDIEVLN
jgi:hypothetical protein